MKRGSFSRLKPLFSFERIVGYMTIAGSIATVYGVEKIYNLTVELKPIIEVFQNEPGHSVIRDTITVVVRDTVFYPDTIYVPLRDTVYTPRRFKIEKDWQRKIYEDEERFRKRHGLS